MSDKGLAKRRGVDAARIETAVRDLLHAIGEDPARPGLLDTPRRVADFWREFVDYKPGTINTVFEDASCDAVIVGHMRVWSLCEHHLMPFWCDVSVGYVPNGKVLGLSKFGRIAHRHAHRLQLQERLVSGIADEVKATTNSPDVMVMGRGEHLCMTMRGIRTGSCMISTSAHGRYREDAAMRSEFLRALGCK